MTTSRAPTDLPTGTPTDALVAPLDVRSRRGRLLVFAMVLGSSATFFNATVVNVALPAIGDDFGVGVSSLQWIATGYMVTLAALILIGGSLGDVLGRRRIFVVSSVVLTVASIVCALAPTLPVLVIGRLLQGVAAAGVTPISLAIVNSSFPEDQRGRAVAAWSGGSAVASAIGPFAGGVLVDHGGWRWVFALSVPMTVVSVIAVLRAIPRSTIPRSTIPSGAIPSGTTEANARRFDVVGAVLSALAIGAPALALTRGLANGWSDPVVIGAGIVSTVAIASFVPVELHRTDPMVPMRMFTSMQFSGTNAVTLLLYAGLSGAFFFTALAFQTVVGFSPTAAGATLLPANLIMIAAATTVGKLSGRIGARALVAGGSALVGLSLLMLSTVGASSSYVSGILPAVIMMGFGLVMFVPPLTSAVLAAVEERDVGIGSAVNNAVARTGGLVAVAVLPGLVNAPSEASDPLFVDAYRVAMVICAALCACAAVIAVATIRTAMPPPEPV